MSSRLWGAGACLVLGVAISTAARAESPARELPVAEWSRGETSLEDFKGQVAVLLFYDDASS